MKVRLAQCWDDGTVTDIRLCELLRKHRATASFNLNPGTHQKERYTRWKHQDKDVWKLARAELTEVYEGFLVANHTYSHPKLTQISPEEARREITEGRDALEQLFGYRVEGFAYPHGDHNAAVREMVRSSGHLYARSIENAKTVIPPEDAMNCKPSCHFLAGNFWEEFEHVRRSQNVFYFWGHSCEIHTEEDWRAFEDKIERLGQMGEWILLPSLFQSQVLSTTPSS